MRLSSLIVCLALLSSPAALAQNPIDQHGALSVSGNQIVDMHGSAFSVAGNSFFWSNTTWGAEPFYNAEVVNWLKEDWNSAIVRASMGVQENGGFLADPTGNRNRVITLVDAAIAEGLYVLIDWHSHEAETHEAEAIAFFQDMATRYGDSPNVIYEIYNEPLPSSWSNSVKPYAEAVIAAIRAIDPDNLIVVGSPTWSQDVDIASADPITGYDNIAYSLHFYAGTHGAGLRAKAETALANGIALMVTEWGTVNATGDGAVATEAVNEWMDFMRDHQLTHLNWSVHDKEEGASIVRPGASPTGNWSAADLTPSGTFVRDIVREWNQLLRFPSRPDNLTTRIGDRAQFKVSLISPVWSVQWQKNGIDIPGATQPTFDIAQVEESDAGSYRAVISATGQPSYTSRPSTLSTRATGQTNFANISTRGVIGSGENAMIGGFVINGDVAKTVLVRVVGPGLTEFGINNTAANPALLVAGENYLGEVNENWTDNDNLTALIETTEQVGAFPLVEGSPDAATLIVLPSGAYTVRATDLAGSGGVALLEVYEVAP